MALYWKFDPLGTAGGKSPYFELTVAATADSLTWGFTPYIPAGGTLTVDWGDGTTNDYNGNSSARRDHTYAAAGDYRVRLIAVVTRLIFGSSSAPLLTYAGMVTGCNFNWGVFPSWTDFGTAFTRCANLTSTCTTLPDTVTRLQGTFNGCNNLRLKIKKLPSALNVAGALANAFQACFLAEIDLDALAANAPSGGWTGVTSLNYAFYQCGVDNSPGTCTGSQSAFLAKFPDVTSTTNAFTGTNTTA